MKPSRFIQTRLIKRVFLLFRFSLRKRWESNNLKFRTVDFLKSKLEFLQQYFAASLISGLVFSVSDNALIKFSPHRMMRFFFL